jgi:hypothetical protein
VSVSCLSVPPLINTYYYGLTLCSSNTFCAIFTGFDTLWTTTVSNMWILNDYRQSRTLGSGSGGRVKLATHNITGEKVRPMVFMTRQWCVLAKKGILRGSLSRSSAVSTHLLPMTMTTKPKISQPKLPNHQRKSGPYVKQPSRRSSTILTFVQCTG